MINIDIATCLGSPSPAGKKVKPSGYTGIWAVSNGTAWVVIYTNPGHGVTTIDFSSCLPNPADPDASYQLYYGANPILDNNGNPVYVNYQTGDSKWHCGT